MQENEDERQEKKQPHEMTSDELLDFVVHPKVAKKLRERVRMNRTTIATSGTIKLVVLPCHG